MKIALQIVLCLILTYFINIENFNGQNKLDSILLNTPSLQSVGVKAENYKLQIILTRVITSPLGDKKFETSEFNVCDTNYFYPASIVKLPASIFALEKLNELETFGVNLNSNLNIDSCYTCQKKLTIDSFNNDSTASIGEFIERALVISDNEAYSRLFEFVGGEYFQNKFKQLQFPFSQITHRFSSCNEEQNRHTNAFHFLDKNGDTLYTQLQQNFNSLLPHNFQFKKIGNYYMKGDSKIKGAKDFNALNCMPLRDGHRVLMELVYPNSQTFNFNISEEQRLLLLKHLTITPKESSIKKIYSNKKFHDNYTNYLFFGNVNERRTTSLSVTNIVGLSYGFATDISYVHDEKTNVEFFLSATIYTNKSNVLGSGNYEYNEIAFPFLKDLGNAVLKNLN